MPLADNLVSYWSLGEASGAALDAKGANNLADNGGVGAAAGVVGGARTFSRAAGQFLAIADNPTVETGDVDFTITGWFKIQLTPTGDPGLVSKWGAGTAREYRLLLVNNFDAVNRRFEFVVRNLANNGAGLINADNLGVPAVGVWYFVCCWHDSVNNFLGINVNGGPDNTLAYSAGVRTDVAPFEVGRYLAVNTSIFDGSIDEVGFWKRVLTPAERADLYNGGAGRSYAYIAGVPPVVGVLVGSVALSLGAAAVASARAPLAGSAGLVLDAAARIGAAAFVAGSVGLTLAASANATARRPLGITDPLYGSRAPAEFSAGPAPTAFATTAKPVYVSTAPPLDPARRNRT